MKIGLVVLFSIFIKIGLCQGVTVTKNNLANLFKLSIQQESQKNISVGSGAWTICNQDSAFFKSSTLTLYSNANYFYQLGKCCNFIKWTFYKDNAVLQSTAQICTEPASAGIEVKYYKIKIINNRKGTYLSIISLNGTVQKFEVVRINEILLAQNNSSKEIVLKRL